MPTDSNLLSAEESANIAGVSKETIEQYVSYGLLEPIVHNNEAKFRESDIRSLFYTRVSKPKTEPAKKHSPMPIDDEEVPSLSQILSETTAESEKIAPSDDEAIEEKSALSEEDSTAGKNESLNSKIEKQEVPDSTVNPDKDLLSSLNAQIELLREERDWLRERVERLETRADREQMLLLSESETVRSLLRSTEVRAKPEPFWKKALSLPWLDKDN